MKKLYLTTALVLGLMAPAHAGMYVVDFTTDNEPGKVTGWITTTCNSCVLNPSNITSWGFELDGQHPMNSTDGVGTVTIFGSSPVTATPDAVVFDPTTPGLPGSYLAFGFQGLPDFVHEPSLVFEAHFESILYGDVIDDRFGRVGIFANSLGQDPIEIAMRAPEPATWMMLGIGFGLTGLVGMKRMRKDRLVSI